MGDKKREKKSNQQTMPDQNGSPCSHYSEAPERLAKLSQHYKQPKPQQEYKPSNVFDLMLLGFQMCLAKTKLENPNLSPTSIKKLAIANWESTKKPHPESKYLKNISEERWKKIHAKS